MRLDYKISDLLLKGIEEIKKLENYSCFFRDNEVEEIIDEYYLTDKKSGIGFVFDSDKKLVNIHLYSGLKDEVEKFKGELPLNLTFDDQFIGLGGEIEFRKEESGGGDILPFVGKTNFWKKYYFDNCYLHIEYNDKNIILITIGS